MTPLKPFIANAYDLQVSGEIVFHEREVHCRFHIHDPSKAVIGSLNDGQFERDELIRTDHLWQSTCLEAFWGVPGEDGYWELNLSPNSSKWNLYRFDRYRDPQPPRACNDFEMTRLVVSGQNLRCVLLSGKPIAKMEASLTAIVKVKDQTLYYAAHHDMTSGKPDFHVRKSFILK